MLRKKRSPIDTMNLLTAKTLIAAGVLAGASLPPSFARSFSRESLNCLFRIADQPRESRAVRFSFSPLAERLERLITFKPMVQPLLTEEAPPEESAPKPSGQFSVSFARPTRSAPIDEEGTENWPLFRALRRWQSNPRIDGLSRGFWDPHSVIALDYSDIFETGRAPYKGGHGVSLFLRHTF
jgi:hypothetical protein